MSAKPPAWQNRITGSGVKPASQFLAHPLNWRQHPPMQREALATSLSRVGWVQQVIENTTTGHLLDGHERVWQALQADDADVPFIQVELTEDEERFVLATLDPISALAEIDGETLKLLAGDDIDLSQFFDADELAAILADAADEPTADPGPQIDKAAELQAKWQTAVGQVWKLGKHRLAIGDCTDETVVSAAMGGERFRIAVTSPPYADQRDYEIGSFDWHALASGSFKALSSAAGEHSDILINLGLSHKDGRVNRYWDKWLDQCEELGWPLYGWYVWDKGSGFPGEWNGRLAPAHEFVFHFSRGHESARKWIETTGESEKRGSGGKRFRQKDGSLKELYSPDTIGQPFKIPDSVIRVGREMARGIHTEAHPAVFPVEFASFMLQTWSKKNDIALEPFCGSGTTIVACEQLDRRARAIELEPSYAAVAIQRWVDLTGKSPERVP